MSTTERCDHIIRLIDHVLREYESTSRPASVPSDERSAR